VTVHEADLVSLDPIEPVDVVLGEWMGRLVVDDRMLDAVAAASRWAKPDARWIPSEVRVFVAPAGGFAFPQVTRWKGTILGLDLSDALPYALHSAYALQLPEAALLGPPAEVAAMRPPAPGGIDAEVTLRVERAGVVQALACWWEADLAPGVTLSTGPGHSTHWGQYLLPVPDLLVSPGDALAVALEAPPSGEVARWTVACVGRASVPAQSTDARLGERSGTASPAPSGREATLAANARGIEALGRGDLAGALQAFGAASCATPDDLAPAVFENLGLAAYNAGDPIAALTALLRAIDGAPGSREQASRFLVQLLRAMGRPEAAAAQTAYESVFGPWRPIG
jgi:hypothetical protein